MDIFLKIQYFIPFVLKCFSIFSIFWLTVYFFIIRPSFMPKKITKHISNVEFPINLAKKNNFQKEKFTILYKTKILITFENLTDYCSFCFSLQRYLAYVYDSYKFADKKTYEIFLSKMDVTNINDNTGSKTWYWPGFYAKHDRIYEEEYGDFTSKAAKFYINYCANKDLSFALFLLQASAFVRDYGRLVNDSPEYGLQSLDIYYNSYIRNKSDILQLWYVLTISEKMNNNFFSEINVYNKFLIFLTAEILDDFSDQLCILQKINLLFFILKNQFINFIDDIVIFLSKFVHKKIINLLYLLPITVLLYVVYNTEHKTLASFGLIIYIVFFSIKQSFDYVFNIINVFRERSHLFFFRRLLSTGLYQVTAMLFNLLLLTCSCNILLIISDDKFSYLFLCVYFTAFLKYLLRILSTNEYIKFYIKEFKL